MRLWRTVRHSPSSLARRWLPAIVDQWPLRYRPSIAMTGRRSTKRHRVDCSTSATSETVTLAIVGDVHDMYGPEDEAALSCLEADVALFVGDFGEENIEIVHRIATVRTPRAVILGNHDAWYSLSGPQPNYEGAQAQQHVLQDLHVGYGSRSFITRAGGHKFIVAGARPFSRGGDGWSRVEAFYAHMCHVNSLEHSASRTAIVLRSAAAAKYGPVILMAHNGPLGLGKQPHDICGVDWRSAGGDHGDPDLQAALQQVQGAVHVPLVVFGHMHHRLNSRHGGALRKMALINAETGTVFLNAAVVPRVEEAQDGTRRHFLVVKLANGEVTEAQHTWVHVSPALQHMAIAQQVNSNSAPQQDQQLSLSPGPGRTQAAEGLDEWQCKLHSREALLRTDSWKGHMLVRTVFDAHAQTWDVPVCIDLSGTPSA